MAESLSAIVDLINGRFAEQHDVLAAIQQQMSAQTAHLATLNGRTSKNEIAASALQKQIDVLAGKVDGHNLERELANARAAGARDVYARWRRVLRAGTSNPFVLKVFAFAVTMALAAIGVGVWK